MKPYLAKIIYRVVCSGEQPASQFDEQLRLIFAEDDLHAFHKARLMGQKEADTGARDGRKPASWQFIDVTEIHLLEEIADGVELFSIIREQENAAAHIKRIRTTSLKLYENCLNKNIFMN